jgi:hypothetical protein
MKVMWSLVMLYLLLLKNEWEREILSLVMPTYSFKSEKQVIPLLLLSIPYEWKRCYAWFMLVSFPKKVVVCKA